MRTLLELVWAALRGNGPWMAWNLVLAVTPLVLAVVLFRNERRPTSKFGGVLWWIGVAAFVALLPNAPYVLTDVVHFVPDVQGVDHLSVALAFMMQYALFFFVGLESYVMSVVLFTRWLGQRDHGRAALPAALAIHVLCAAGVYLGRIERLNSWDVVLRHEQLIDAMDGLASLRGAVLVALTFGVISVAFWLGREVTLAVASFRRTAVRAFLARFVL